MRIQRFQENKKNLANPTPVKSEDSVRESEGSTSTEIQQIQGLKKSEYPPGIPIHREILSNSGTEGPGDLYEIRGLKIFDFGVPRKFGDYIGFKCIFEESYSRISRHLQRLPDSGDCWKTIPQTDFDFLYRQRRSGTLYVRNENKLQTMEILEMHESN